jgi:hypothetical protein
MRTPRYPRLLVALRCSLLTALAGVLLCSAPSSARADIDLRIGAKGMFTLSGLSAPDMPPTPDAPWAGASLSAGFGGGLYGELHASKLLGVELDLLLESNRLFFHGSANDVEFDQRATFGQFRVPLLAKLFLQAGDSFEFNLGLGPELILGMGDSSKTTVTRNQTTLSAGNVQTAFDYFYRADSATGVAVAGEIGCSFYTLRFQIPIAFRFAYNVLGKTAYADRVKIDEMLHTATFSAVETYQMVVLIGFGFLIPPREPPPEPVKRGPATDDPFSPFTGH